MNTIRITLVAAVVLSLAAASQTFANPRPSYAGHAHAVKGTGYVNHNHVNHNYHVNHGTRFNHGYYYRGRTHTHWSYQRYDARYRCTCYFDSGCKSWYYWCQPANCYYPVSYCPHRTYCWTPPPAAPAPVCKCATGCHCTNGCSCSTVAVNVYVIPVTVVPVATPQCQCPSIPAPCATAPSYGPQDGPPAN
jgi:hypothetical protein